MMNGGLSNSVINRDCSQTSGIGPDLSHLLPSQFLSSIVFSCQSLASSFRNLVSHIIGICTKKKMLRIDTRSVVAVVQNTQPFLDFSKALSPKETRHGRGCILRWISTCVWFVRRADPASTLVLNPFNRLWLKRPSYIHIVLQYKNPVRTRSRQDCRAT